MKSPLIPMGAMTGRPDAKRMREVLESYRSVGIDQFMIYPRSGMEYEYMSEEWLRVCEETVRIADELGIKIVAAEFPANNVDFTPYLSSAKDEGAGRRRILEKPARFADSTARSMW